MNLSLPLTLAARLSLILDGLARAVAARSARGPSWLGGPEALAGVLIVLIWRRVKRTEVRIQALLAQFLAGRLRTRAGKRDESRKAAPDAPRGDGARSPQVETKLPRRFGWLLPLVPCEAANFAAQLRLALAEPEMVALLAASPQARRVLAPLGRMLGIEKALLGPRAVTPEPGPDGEAGSEALPEPRTDAGDGSFRFVAISDATDFWQTPHRPSAMRATSRAGPALG